MRTNSALKTGTAALAAVAVGFGVAACGGSSAKGVALAPGDGATVEATTATATTPTSGPLSTEPTASKPSGAAPTSLVKKILVSGSGTKIASGDSISVNYFGYVYATGKPFSGGSSWTSSTASTPFSVQVGAGQVIKGWDEGLVGVKQGSRVELIIPPSLAYGGTTSPLKSDTLVFIIDVLKVSQ